MKNLLLLFATISAMNAKAQTSVYHPFPTTNADWVYQYYDDFHQPTGYFGSYAITGDTIISGTSYKKISGCSAWWFCDSGSIRDSNKVIYFIPDTSSTGSEIILYDFNLNVGDTIIHPYGGAICNNDTITIWQVDSILTSDGYHRQLHLSSFATWIEGIGSTTYLFNPANVLCVSGNDVLVCMKTDSGFAYPPGTGSCIVSAPEPWHQKNKITVSPNPMTDILNIEFSNDELSEINIYDIASRKLMQKKFTNFVSINTEQLSTGLYLYEIRNKEGIFKKGKVVKD